MHIDGMEILCGADLLPALRKKYIRLANKLKLSDKAIEKYIETIAEDVEFVKSGRKSNIVIGARIYIIGLLLNETRTQRQISSVVNGSSANIRKMYLLMSGREKLSREIFSVKYDGQSEQAFWYIVKEKYNVRIVKKTKEGSCDCIADVFKTGGREQVNCKHIEKVLEVLKELNVI